MVVVPCKLYYSIFLSAASLGLLFYLTYADNLYPKTSPLDIPSTANIASIASIPIPIPAATPAVTLSSSLNTTIDSFAEYFINYPLNGPNYGDQFGEFGKRIQILRDWITLSETGSSSITTKELQDVLEKVVISMLPFLRNPSRPDDPTPFKNLRQSYIPGSRGIVMTTGLPTFRFACHLIATIREVHHSTLPIQIFYAGDADLPPENRQILASLGNDIELVDILLVFDDTLLQLESRQEHHGWAIKAFAALASKYEQIILLDADAVLVQPPKVIFDQRDYIETGALLYHDRLLWQHGFQERHDWWKKQMEHQQPSPALLKSLVWTEDYAEEQDSGLVAIDKGRLSVLMGLLHICWQNTYPVREQTTYKITYGDKESWWFGFELCGTPFAFEKHYGSVAGSLHKIQNNGTDTDEEKVCSFTIAHTDQDDNLLWYNGGLLRNKATDDRTFDVPTHWMMDATWEKGNSKPEMSCMRGGTVRELLPAETVIIEQSVKLAERIDNVHSLVAALETGEKEQE